MAFLFKGGEKFTQSHKQHAVVFPDFNCLKRICVALPINLTQIHEHLLLKNLFRLYKSLN